MLQTSSVLENYCRSSPVDELFNQSRLKVLPASIVAKRIFGLSPIPDYQELIDSVLTQTHLGNPHNTTTHQSTPWKHRSPFPIIMMQVYLFYIGWIGFSSFSGTCHLLIFTNQELAMKHLIVLYENVIKPLIWIFRLITSFKSYAMNFRVTKQKRFSFTPTFVSWICSSVVCSLF